MNRSRFNTGCATDKHMLQHVCCYYVTSNLPQGQLGSNATSSVFTG